MADLDTLLRDSFERLAEPGDPSGVARAIQARVDAGGNPGPSGGPGGGVFGGFRSWIPWVGLALVAGIAGGAAGAGGVFGVPPTPAPGVQGATDGGVEALGCPGGSAVQTLQPGERVLAVERSEDAVWLGVRDPYALTRIVWLPTGVVVVDPGQPAVDTLAIGACPPAPSLDPLPVVTEAPAPAPAPEPAPAPKPTKTSAPPPPPPPPPDTTAPSISAGSFSPQPINQAGWEGSCAMASSSTVTITASDASGIASIAKSSNAAGATVSQMSHSGDTWTFKFQMSGTYPPAWSFAPHSATVTFTATDGAGNTASTTADIAVEYCLG